MKFRPCIDLHSGAVKQIVGATLKDGEEPATNFESKDGAAHFAKLYKDNRLTGGHVIMLGPGNKEATMEALQAYPGGLQVGGGITLDNAQEFLEAGASHVIVTSFVFKDGKVDFERLEALANLVSPDRLVLDLSCRKRPTSSSSSSSPPSAIADDIVSTDSTNAHVDDADAVVVVDVDNNYYVVTDRWQKFTDFAVTKENLEKLSTYCSEFLVHGVEVEGLRLGVVEDLVEKLGKWSPIPVTYAGGARSIADFERVKTLGGGKVDLTIGSALDVFGGDVKFTDVCAWHDVENKQQQQQQ